MKQDLLTRASYLSPFDLADGFRRLLADGADVDEEDTTGATPLMRTAYSNHFEAVGVLLDAGARLDAEDADGNTPLHYAAQGLAVNSMAAMLAAGAFEDAGNQSGETPADLAVQAAFQIDADGHESAGNLRAALELLAAAGGTMSRAALASASGYVRGVCEEVMAGRIRPLAERDADDDPRSDEDTI